MSYALFIGCLFHRRVQPPELFYIYPMIIGLIVINFGKKVEHKAFTNTDTSIR